jgi:hypothetical protein
MDMESLHECNIPKWLKESDYCITFLKAGNGELLVPKEFIFQNINTYENFFNILEKLDFYMLRIYPDEIYDWIFDNITKIDIKHLLDSILNNTDIVKQINIIINGGSKSTVSDELELAGYYHCAKIANEKGYKSTYENFYSKFLINKNLYVYNLTKKSKELFTKYDNISSKNEVKLNHMDFIKIMGVVKGDEKMENIEFNEEFYFEKDIDYSLIDSDIRCKFESKYGIILTFENIKKFLLRIIEYYMMKEIEILYDRLQVLDKSILYKKYGDEQSDFKDDKYTPIIRKPAKYKYVKD